MKLLVGLGHGSLNRKLLWTGKRALIGFFTALEIVRDQRNRTNAETDLASIAGTGKTTLMYAFACFR